MSFDHKKYNRGFLEQDFQIVARIDDARNKYAVRIVEADVAPGEAYWRVIGVHHLRPEENLSKQNVFVDVLDESGNRIPVLTAQLAWTWEGRRSDERADPAPLDKPDGEPFSNVIVNPPQHVAVWVEGLVDNTGLKSDRVENLHNDHPDERGPNNEIWSSYGHHSFYVVFQRTRKGESPATQPAIEPEIVQPQEAAPPPEPATPAAPPPQPAPEPQTAPAATAAVGQWPAHYPEYIYGLHETGGESLMVNAGRTGWVLELANVGLNPSGGPDYTKLSEQGIGMMVRLNHGYAGAGTLPEPQHYPQFAQACATYVRASKGCHIWIIANEPNHHQEWPGGKDGHKITPQNYAQAYKLCRQAIRRVKGHENDQVLVAGSAPWNTEVKYPGNEKGDWIKYFVDTLALIGNNECDGFAIHTYTHMHDPGKINSDHFHASPAYNYLRNEFRTYQQYMEAIPDRFRHLPVFITETDPTTDKVGWEGGRNLGWIRTAYREIADWNRDPAHQPIQALILYRWPKSDQTWWAIFDKPGLIEDFTQALHAQPAADYRLRASTAKSPPLRIAVRPPVEEITVPDFVTNQHMIDAFKNAHLKLNPQTPNPWGLMEKADVSLTDLAIPTEKRFQQYTGPAIDQLPYLTTPERQMIKAELVAIVGPEVSFGAGMSFSFAATPEDPAPAGFLRMRPGLADIPLAPDKSMQLELDAAGNNLEKRVVRTWNRYGWFLLALADGLKLDPGVAVAVLAGQSQQRGFAGNGRMIIRFDNLLFFDKWGQQHPDTFKQHFKFDDDRPWQKHQWRPAKNQAWRDVHGKQSDEWAAFEFAAGLNDTAAKLSIAMGLPQLLGINYTAIGHMSVDQMYLEFSTSEQYQIMGLFDLICGPATQSRQLVALQNRDFDTFATLHKGVSQAARFSGTLYRAYTAYKKFKLA